PVEPVEVAVNSGTARDSEPAGAGPGGAEPGVAESEGAEPGGAEPERVEPGRAEPGVSRYGGSPSLRSSFVSGTLGAVFLGFPPDAPGWQFYHPTSRCVLSSQEVMFDKSVSYYHPVEPVEVAVNSGTARDSEPAGAGPGGAEPGVAKSEGAEPGGAELERVEPGRTEPGGAESGGAKPGAPFSAAAS
ncbi:unnamed protein product, partial [Closterium sp. NIES-53]